ncbi:MAG: hypothetical protein ACJ781_07235 [Myxococcales bacterium]|jgi:hypothetical protein
MAKIPGPGFDVIGQLRKMRDQGMDTWAKAAIRFTSSEPYQRMTGILVQPGLLATALVRNSTEKAMSDLLARLNMPSREEVLSLSQRLTRIEVVLDDLSAAVDAFRGANPHPEAQPEASPARASQGNGDGMRVRIPAAGEN